MTIQELKDLLPLLRAQGVSTFEWDGLKLAFDAGTMASMNAIVERMIPKPHQEPEPVLDERAAAEAWKREMAKDLPEMSDEEMLYWSVKPDDVPQPEDKK